MKYKYVKTLSCILSCVLLAACLSGSARAAGNQTLDAAVEKAAVWLHAALPDPRTGAVGGDWAVLGLARSGYNIPDEWFEMYARNVRAAVEDCGGVLDERKYTEYARVALGLTAAGYDPRDVSGYDLTLPLGDFDKTVWQGVNGPIWALLALDSADYPIPPNKEAKTQATRDMYVAEILRRQLSDGGWNLSGSGAPACDVTSMALQALAKYQDMAEVKTAVGKALAWLSGQQKSGGGFEDWGVVNPESAAQVLLALTELGLEPIDPRFVKNGNTLVDSILSFARSDGGFDHSASGGDTQMAAEQVLCGLVAAQRFQKGENSLFRMGDAVKRGAPPATGLPGKHPDVAPPPVSLPNATFADIQGGVGQFAIEALAARGILNGKGANRFDPDGLITRTELTAAVTRCLGLTPKPVSVFEDVPSSAWYAGSVGTAYTYGIVNGTSPKRFTPDGAITRQEAAVVLARTAKLCGLVTELDDTVVREALSAFTDRDVAADWARSSVAFCLRQNILARISGELNPREPITRNEIAVMLYRTLRAAALL